MSLDSQGFNGHSRSLALLLRNRGLGDIFVAVCCDRVGCVDRDGLRLCNNPSVRPWLRPWLSLQLKKMKSRLCPLRVLKAAVP